MLFSVNMCNEATKAARAVGLLGKRSVYMPKLSEIPTSMRERPEILFFVFLK